MPSRYSPPPKKTTTITTRQNKSKLQGCGFILVAPIERIPNYYLYNVVLVLFAIVLTTPVVIGIPPEDLADRLSVTLTLILTAVAFKFVVADWTPRVRWHRQFLITLRCSTRFHQCRYTTVLYCTAPITLLDVQRPSRCTVQRPSRCSMLLYSAHHAARCYSAHHAARCYVLIAVLSACVVPQLGL